MTRIRQNHPFGILMYHRVAPLVPGVAKPTWNVAPERFRRQLQGLLSRGYQAWPLRRVLACRLANEPIPHRVFVVTFDDGYDNFHEDAWPILKELSIPASVFLTTSYLDADRPFVSDDWVAAGATGVPASTWKPLSTSHCMEMIEHGLVEIGSHTHTHADYRGRTEAFCSDLLESQHVLQDRLHIAQASFAFPYGYHDSALVEAARRSGMTCALTTDEEFVAPSSDPFCWGRFKVKEYDTAFTLELKFNRWYVLAQRVKRWLRRHGHLGCDCTKQHVTQPQSNVIHTRTSH